MLVAIGCAHGDPEAIAILDRHYLPKALKTLNPRRFTRHQIEDVAQELRTYLLVRRADSPPRILQYSGRGSFVAWLGVIALRLALQLHRNAIGARHVDFDHAMRALAAPERNVELADLKRRFGGEFRSALQQGLERLDARARAVLRLRFVEGVAVETIAKMYRVHRVTASRWVAQAQAEIARSVRRTLRSSLELAAPELDSLLRWLPTEVSLSLSCLRHDI